MFAENNNWKDKGVRSSQSGTFLGSLISVGETYAHTKHSPWNRREMNKFPQTLCSSFLYKGTGEGKWVLAYSCPIALSWSLCSKFLCGLQRHKYMHSCLLGLISSFSCVFHYSLVTYFTIISETFPEIHNNREDESTLVEFRFKDHLLWVLFKKLPSPPPPPLLPVASQPKENDVWIALYPAQCWAIMNNMAHLDSACCGAYKNLNLGLIQCNYTHVYSDVNSIWNLLLGKCA